LFNYLGVNQNLLHFSLSVNEPKKIESINLENFYGFLEGVNTGSPNPIIAIVSHYDTFSISPVRLRLHRIYLQDSIQMVVE
jgi:hypothetical protein